MGVFHLRRCLADNDPAQEYGGREDVIAAKSDYMRPADPVDRRLHERPMQHHKTSTFIAAHNNPARRGTLTGTVRLLWPYIWPSDRADLKLRVFLAVALMLLSKLFTIAIPYSYKWATDAVANKLALDAVPLPRVLIGAAALTAPLRRLAHPDGVHPARARRPVRGGRHERGAPIGDRGVRALASPVVALSSGAQDRRTHARSRARPQRDRDASFARRC